MEELKTNEEIRAEVSTWADNADRIIRLDDSMTTSILGSFMEPWTLALAVGELKKRNLRWREISANPNPRLRCLQVLDGRNLLDWPEVDFRSVRMRPTNLFEPPSRSDMLDVLAGLMHDAGSIGDAVKIEGGWAVSVLSPEGLPESAGGFSIRDLAPEEIAQLPAATSTGLRKVLASSLRTDAVTSQVLKPSREKVKKYVASGGVLINYEPVKKPGHDLCLNDIVAVRGAGRYRLEEVGEETKKGRINLIVEVINGP